MIFKHIHCTVEMFYDLIKVICTCAKYIFQLINEPIDRHLDKLSDPRVSIVYKYSQQLYLIKIIAAMVFFFITILF